MKQTWRLGRLATWRLGWMLCNATVRNRTIAAPLSQPLTMRVGVFAAAVLALSTAVHVPETAWKKAFDFAPSESHPHAGVETHDGGFLMVSSP